jgi:hypothetical protein
MGGACSSDGGVKRHVQGFGGETLRKRPLGRHKHRWEGNIKMDLATALFLILTKAGPS